MHVIEMCALRLSANRYPDSRRMRDDFRRLLDKAENRPLSAVLPKVIIFAESNGLTDLATWARLELLGYGAANPSMAASVIVPEYRGIGGHWEDEYRRPLIVQEGKVAAIVNEVRLRQPIGELEALIEGRGTIGLRIPELAATLQRELQVQVSTFCFSPATVRQLVANVRAQLHSRLAEVAPQVPHVLPRERGVADDIVELKPNFFGLGVNLRAAWRWARRSLWHSE